MPQGGRQPGAGRPLNARDSLRSKLAHEVLRKGISPLEVMLDHMREQHALALKADDDEQRHKHMAAAAQAAKDAAPYVHPRLNAIDHSASGAMSWFEVFKAVDDIVGGIADRQPVRAPVNREAIPAKLNGVH